MIKNTASQKVGAQMVAAADGSAFTSAVTVYVTLDAGAQAIGSVGAGACTHEGNGYHTYAPAQAETNGDLASYTFIGTGAVPQTVQVYTRAAAPDVNVATFTANALTAAAINADAFTAAKFAADVTTEFQTGLATAAALATVNGFLDTEIAAIITTLGTPAGASISADIAAIEAQTDDIGAAGAGLTAIPWNAAWDAEVQSEVEDAIVVHRLDELLNADSDIDGAAPPTVGSVFHELMSKTAGSFTYDQATDSNEALRDNLATASALATAQTSIDDIPTNAELATSQGTADDATLAAIAALSIPSAATIAGAVWDEDATAHQTQGTFGQAIGDPVADTNTIFKAVVTDATGATVGADVVAVKAETAAILDDTDDIGVAGAGLTALATQASVNIIDDFLDTELAALITTVGVAGAGLTALATQASVTAIDDLLDTEMPALTAAVADLPTNAELATALGTADDATLAAIAALSIPTAAQNADALLDRNIAGGSNGGRDVTSALRAIRNKVSISAGTLTVTEEDDTTSAWTAAVVTTAGDPISSVDPA